MSDLSAACEALLGNDAQLPIDRAASELRAGRPIIIDAANGGLLVAALDAISPAGFSIFVDAEDGMLALSPHRAWSLGLKANGPIRVPLSALDRDGAYRLATAPDITAPVIWAPGEPIDAAAIALCKYALLLPAVVATPVEPGARFANVHHVTLDRLDDPPPRRPLDLELIADAKAPLTDGVEARFVVFRGGPAPRDQVAVVIGRPDPAEPVLVRAHSACLTGDLFGSLRCDCGDQLRTAMARLKAAGGGVLLYLDQEGRGIGIGNKMRAYSLQNAGFDTIDADAILGFGPDERRYEYAAAMLAKLGYRRIRLLTNNPGKIDALTRAGIEIVARQPLLGAVRPENRRYLHTKAKRADHRLEDLSGLAE